MMNDERNAARVTAGDCIQNFPADNTSLPQAEPQTQAVAPAYPVPLPRTAAPTADTFDKWAILGSWLLGYLYINWILFASPWPSWYLGAFIGCFCLAIECFCLLKKLPANTDSWVFLGCLLCVGICCCFNRCNAVSNYLYLILHGFALCWVTARTGLLTDNLIGPFCVWDICKSAGRGFIKLFLRLQVFWATVTGHNKNSTEKKNILPTLLAMVAAVPLLLWAVFLLGEADSLFAAEFSDWLEKQFAALDSRFFWTLLLSIPVGAYLYGLVVGSARQLSAKRKSQSEYLTSMEKLRCVPSGALVAVISVFCLLYLVFFLAQFRYLFGVFTGHLPEGFLVSEYARQGFFELCKVMGLNFALLIGAARFCKRPMCQNTSLRTAGQVLMAESLLLAVTALSKLWLYIDTYSFTAKRLLALWLICVLLVSVVLTMIRLVNQMPVIRKIVLFACVSLALLCIW